MARRSPASRRPTGPGCTPIAPRVRRIRSTGPDGLSRRLGGCQRAREVSRRASPRAASARPRPRCSPRSRWRRPPPASRRVGVVVAGRAVVGPGVARSIRCGRSARRAREPSVARGRADAQRARRPRAAAPAPARATRARDPDCPVARLPAPGAESAQRADGHDGDAELAPRALIPHARAGPRAEKRLTEW